MLRFISSVFFVLAFAFSTLAADVMPTPKDMEVFFNQYSNLMNHRQMDKIDEFVNYYVDPNAKFSKETELVDADDPNVIVESEKLMMNRDEYKKYLRFILLPQNQYLYQQNIKEVRAAGGNIYFVSIETQETMTRGFMDKKSGKEQLYYVLSYGNWVYTLSYENATYIIRGVTWREKLNRTQIDKSQVK